MDMERAGHPEIFFGGLKGDRLCIHTSTDVVGLE